MNVFFYIRVSGRGQVGGEGPDRQRETCDQFSRPYKLNCIGEYFEKGVSGTVEGMERPTFAAMIDGILCRRINGIEVDGIVVERMDRLARDLMVQEVLLKQCRENNIKVFAADRGELVDLASDDGDPTRTLIRQVMGALAQWEKSQTVLKLRKAREAVKRKTGRCEGAKPFYTENSVVVKLVELFIRPEHTLKEAAAVLNEQGCTTKSGRPWSEQSVFKLLKALGKWKPRDPVAYRLKNLGVKQKVMTIDEHCKKPQGSFNKFVEEQEQEQQ